MAVLGELEPIADLVARGVVESGIGALVGHVGMLICSLWHHNWKHKGKNTDNDFGFCG